MAIAETVHYLQLYKLAFLNYYSFIKVFHKEETTHALPTNIQRPAGSFYICCPQVFLTNKKVNIMITFSSDTLLSASRPRYTRTEKRSTAVHHLLFLQLFLYIKF